MEEPDHDAGRDAGAGPRHRRHHDDVRVAECGGVAAVAVPRVRPPGRVVGQRRTRRSVERRGTSIPDYLDWRAKSQLVRSDVGVVAEPASSATAAARRSGSPAKSSPAITSTRSASSRSSAASSRRQTMTANAPLVAVIGERLWERAFGRNADCDRPIDPARHAGLHDRRRRAGAFTGRSDASEVWVSMIALTPPQGRAAARQPRIPCARAARARA